MSSKARLYPSTKLSTTEDIFKAGAAFKEIISLPGKNLFSKESITFLTLSWGESISKSERFLDFMLKAFGSISWVISSLLDNSINWVLLEKEISSKPSSEWKIAAALKF